MDLKQKLKSNHSQNVQLYAKPSGVQFVNNQYQSTWKAGFNQLPLEMKKAHVEQYWRFIPVFPCVEFLQTNDRIYLFIC